MRLAVSGIATEADLKCACGVGADAIGFRVGQNYSGDNLILSSTAERLAEKTPIYVTPILVTQETDIDELLSLVERTGIRTLEIEFFDPDNAHKLHDKLPKGARIIQRIFVSDVEAMDNYESLYPVISAFVLDFRQSIQAVSSLPGDCEWMKGADLIRRSPHSVLLSGFSEDNESMERLVDLPEFYGMEVDLQVHDGLVSCNLDVVSQYMRLMCERKKNNG